MGDPIDELRKEIMQIRNVMLEREKRTSRIEAMVKTIDAEELSKQIKAVNTLLVGTEGNNGLKKTVERLTMLIDGNEQYGVVGICDQIESLGKEVANLVMQRNQIKWAIVGILAVTTLGNAEGIFNLIKAIFG